MRINSKMLARYISRECTDHENQMIKEYINSNTDYAKSLKTLQDSLNLKEIPARPIDVDAKWKELHQRVVVENARPYYQKNKQNINKFEQKRLSLHLLRYAAIFVFTVLATYFLAQSINNMSLDNDNAMADKFKILNVQNGERQNITLADGSIVTVDAGSEFKYFTDYDNERHVFLKGEACFKITPDKQKPFFVHANRSVIRVVGTRFNVRSWDDNVKDVITVAEGKVAVSRDDLFEPTKTIVLAKDEQSTIPANGPLTHAANIDADQYFLWMQNEIHFVDSKVKQVVAQLERWYDFHFIFQDPTLLEQSISVHIKGANIEEVIRVISVVTETKIRRNGKQIEFMIK